MTMQELQEENRTAMQLWYGVQDEICCMPRDTVKTPISATAGVYETEHFYVLCSYCTLVAAISKVTGSLVNMVEYSRQNPDTCKPDLVKFLSKYGSAHFEEYRYTELARY